MAEVVRYVNTASTPGGDGTTNATAGATRAYASLNEWEAAEQTDLPTDGDSHLVHCEGAAADTTAWTVSGWTTDATHDITIQVDADKRHSGEWSTDHYRISAADTNYLVNIFEDYVTAVGLQIGLSSATATRIIMYIASTTATTNQIKLDKCILKGADDDTHATRCLYINDTDTKILIRNCLVYDGGHCAGAYGIYGSSDIVEIQNTTVANCWICIRITGVTSVTETNVLCDEVDAVSASYTWYSNPSTRTYCTSNDDKADDQGGAGNRINQTFTYSSGYLLASDDAGARDYGTDLEVAEGFNDDIAGNTRGATWDIGCSEYVGGGATYNETVTDGFGMGDILLNNAIFSSSITDGLSGGDAQGNIAELISSLTDGVSAGDTTTALGEFISSIVDGLAMSDALTSLANQSVSVSDGVGVGDTLSSLGEFVHSLSDGVKLGDVPAGYLIIPVSVSDSVALSDAVQGIIGLYGGVSDSFVVSDATSHEIVFMVTVSDGMTVSDVVSSIAEYNLSVSDGAVFVDATVLSVTTNTAVIRFTGKNKSFYMVAVDRKFYRESRDRNFYQKGAPKNES